MREEAMSDWACPRDGHFPLSLEVAERVSDEIVEGYLACGQCGSKYKIADGIPDFLIFEDDATEKIKRSELASREKDLEMPQKVQEIYLFKIETEAVLRRLKPTSGDHILDAGCGIGRITEKILDCGASVVATDFSRSRLEVFRSRIKPYHQVEFALADVNHMPLRPDRFSKIISTQVLEHIPTSELRRAFLAKLHDLLIPGGSVVLTLYNYDRDKQKRGFPREGFHDSGIFYHCYDSAELRSDLQGFEIREICAIRHLLPGTYKYFPRLGWLGRLMDHSLERIPVISLQYGILLLAYAVKK
jgi:SAM-dependent methyltransferase